MARSGWILATFANLLTCLSVESVEGAVGGAWIDMSHPFSNTRITYESGRRQAAARVVLLVLSHDKFTKGHLKTLTGLFISGF